MIFFSESKNYFEPLREKKSIETYHFFSVSVHFNIHIFPGADFKI